ncbi:zf-HC2 domain-containing protein [Pyxidicoccus parkwayensis]|uniref:zf-HC2 domain-containing protein n=1 Tax=Pyxidicoccus parkwayensis TaxID=2813578 RepID=UPI001F50C1F2|nr:tetratricopeptide repeat protein [Pyxidicoccus parkwaysis]
MSSQCDKLYLFLDGELGPVDEEKFRHHLARCEPCATGLHEAMQLELLSLYALGDTDAAAKVHAEPVKPAPARQQRRPLLTLLPGGRLAAGAVLALAGVLATLAVVTPSQLKVSREVWLAQAPTRRLEARVAYAPADGHRPYAPLRSATGTSEPPRPPPLRELADLEDAGDLHGIAAAYLVRKDWRQAADFLQRTPPSPDRDSDRAIILLEQGRPKDALSLLEGVLRQVPTHPQAQWNRALVLRELGLTLPAAEAFEAVAKLGEPGWSEEALIRARALRHETHAHGVSWNTGLAAMH